MESKKNDKQGKKDTKGKVRMELLPMEALRSVAEILTFGAEKYGANNWQNIDDGYNLFWGALLRHKTLKDMGEEFDKESGKPHDAHIACNALFMLYYSLHKHKETHKETRTIETMADSAITDWVTQLIHDDLDNAKVDFKSYKFDDTYTQAINEKAYKQLVLGNKDFKFFVDYNPEDAKDYYHKKNRVGSWYLVYENMSPHIIFVDGQMDPNKTYAVAAVSVLDSFVTKIHISTKSHLYKAHPIFIDFFIYIIDRFYEEKTIQR